MTLGLWVDAFDTAGRKLVGPITNVTNVSIRRALDGAGTIGIGAPGTDRRALELLTNERRVAIYTVQRREKRELSRGILRSIKASDGTSWTLTASGVDALDELKRRTVGINRAYSEQPVQTIVADLVGLVPGWSITCDVLTELSIRMDAVSVLKALQKVAEVQGLHLRPGTTPNTLEFGAFGESAGLTLMNVEQVGLGVLANDNIALIDRITVGTNSQKIANRIVVLGAGQNVDSAFTLERSTRTGPYPIYQRELNGRTEYYIEDEASIALYGVLEQYVQLKEIAPLSTADPAEIAAANALYDAAVAWLQRNSTPQENYSVSVRKAMRGIRPGEKVRVRYVGRIRDDEGELTYRDINQDFWVMTASESVGLNGVSQSLEISNIDRYEETSARVVMGAIDQIRVQGAAIQPTFSHYLVGPEQVQLDDQGGTDTAQVQLLVSDAVKEIIRVLMRIRTRPFRSNVLGGESVGHDHVHLRIDDNPPNPGASSSTKKFTFLDQLTSTTYWFEANTSGPTPSVLSMTTAGSHKHPTEYGIYIDSLRPGDLTIAMNGLPVASGVGTSGADFTAQYDITEQVLAKSGGVRGVHTVDFSCGAGRGEIVVEFDIYEVIVPYKIASG